MVRGTVEKSENVCKCWVVTTAWTTVSPCLATMLESAKSPSRPTQKVIFLLLMKKLAPFFTWLHVDWRKGVIYCWWGWVCVKSSSKKVVVWTRPVGPRLVNQLFSRKLCTVILTKFRSSRKRKKKCQKRTLRFVKRPIFANQQQSSYYLLNYDI